MRNDCNRALMAKLKLVIGSQITTAKILVDLNFVVWYGIPIQYKSRGFALLAPAASDSAIFRYNNYGTLYLHTCYIVLLIEL